MIPIRELDAACEQQIAGGVSVFGHAVEFDAVQAVSDMLYQELRQFAEKLVKRNPAKTNRLIDFLIDAFADQPATVDTERHERIGRMIRNIMTVDELEVEELAEELADERMVEQSNQTALADEEDYYGVRLPASAQ